MGKIISLLFGVCLLMTANPVSAQRGLPGQVGLGIQMGTVDGLLFRDSHRDYRFWGALELTRYNRRHTYWNFSAECLRKDYLYRGITGDQVVPVAQFTAETGYNFPLLSDRGRHVSLVAGIAGLSGYETSG